MASKQRPANTTVRHGMPSCARYGCTKAECIKAFRRVQRESYHNLKQGVSAIVSASEAAEHVRKLILAGRPTLDIAERSGVSTRLVRDLFYGRRETIYRDTSEAILGVPMPDEDYVPSVDGHMGATGTCRRLRALSIQGFPLLALAEGANASERAITRLRAGSQRRVLVSTMRSIKDMHDRLWDEDPLALEISPGAVMRIRRWAQEQGWHPTEAWSDIDDPDCEPVLNVPQYVALAEDAQELMSEYQYTAKEAADRLGVSPQQLGNALSHYNKAKSKAVVT